MYGGPWDSTLNMMGVPSLKLGVPSFYISFEFWKVVHPWRLSVVPRSVILRAMFGPLPIFLGGHSKFLRATYYHQWNTMILYTFFIQKLNLSLWYAGTKLALKFREKKWLLPPVQIGIEKFEKIERSDRLLHPEDRKNSLWSDCSLTEIKKTHKKQSLIRLLLAFHSEKFGWKIWNTHDLAVIVFYLSVYKSPLIWSLWYLWSILPLSLLTLAFPSENVT